jgi:hypothetical protein
MKNDTICPLHLQQSVNDIPLSRDGCFYINMIGNEKNKRDLDDNSSLCQ